MMMVQHKAVFMAFLASVLVGDGYISNAAAELNKRWDAPTWSSLEGLTCKEGLNTSVTQDGSPAPAIDYGVYGINPDGTKESEPRCELHCQPTEQELSGMHRNCLGCAACSQNSGQCQFDTKFITDGEGCCEGGKLGRCSPSRTCEISDSSPSCDAAQFPGFLQEKPLPENLTTVQQEFLSAVGGGDRCGVLGLVAVLALVVVLS